MKLLLLLADLFGEISVSTKDTICAGIIFSVSVGRAIYIKYYYAKAHKRREKKMKMTMKTKKKKKKTKSAISRRCQTL